MKIKTKKAAVRIGILALCLLLSACGTASEDGAAESEARTAYESLLAGDPTVVALREDTREARYETWQYLLPPEGEYLLLDLDGDGVSELLLRWDGLQGYAVYHYADGQVHIWQLDLFEMYLYDIPLRDGTMVRCNEWCGRATRSSVTGATGARSVSAPSRGSTGATAMTTRSLRII